MGNTSPNLCTGNEVNVRIVRRILDELSNEKGLRYENLLETLENKEREQVNRSVKFHQEDTPSRHFPRFYMEEDDYTVLHISFYLSEDDLMDSRHVHMLKQISIAIVLSCSIPGFVDALEANESYDSFARKFKCYYDLAAEFYTVLDSQLNGGQTA